MGTHHGTLASQVMHVAVPTRSSGMNDHELVSPIDVAQWRVYHDIRRRVLFEVRGRIGVYDANHPDERAPGHHPKLLLYRGDPVGVVRVDIDAAMALLRRVAVRADVQRRGHGRALISLVERFAHDNGCGRLVSHVAPDAVEFYRRCGFTIEEDQGVRPAGSESVLMTKPVAE
jgi:GNAT superfamily N-acetyltransferase